VDPRYRSPEDRKYLFPEAGIFAAANEFRRATYFATWSAIEPACIYRLLSSTAAPLSSQEWRDVLIGGIQSKSPHAKSAQARENAALLLGSALQELGIQINQSPSLTTTPSLPDPDAQKILWKVTELNFRFELLGLDKRARPSNENEDAREDLIKECLGTNSLLVVDYEEANVGLRSGDWRERLPCLLGLRRLMKDWNGMKPLLLLQQDLPSTDYQEGDVLQLENGVARFYTDSFFLFFGRAAVIPARLP
jgi:hypothetical protein